MLFLLFTAFSLSLEKARKEADQQLGEAGFDGIIGIETSEFFVDGIQAIGNIGLNQKDMLGIKYVLKDEVGTALFVDIVFPHAVETSIGRRIRDMLKSLAFTYAQ